ncbi:hypothetical protein Poli38472_007006 [Pythium oligandrum]|uniref:PDZ domain-containing protein n=1 Tax=Pythium oligandrum TaxID=41045 RepID=A0A8K1FDY5_PYTOL|nr:hypothetical protein Poli38472_007006 [Pythium oligandrum]|eukprot:TMW58861.1 hypothetical protein Poli38472_007006 [Pythium oligandrum]
MNATEGASIVTEFEQLSAQKDAIEAEIAAIAEELTSGVNAPGLQGPLVDADGFPRADIDVYRVRHQRHTFACKQTDHKMVMKRIEQLLPQLFEARKAASATKMPSSGEPPAPTAMPVKDQATKTAMATVLEDVEKLAATKKPFAVVDSVQDDSPAAWADLRAGDQVLAFGTADASNHRNLEAIKEIVLRNIGANIRVLVRRQSTLTSAQENPSEAEWEAQELTLTPQKWRGAGFLGCLILPLQQEP